jgi:hypothetical protein
MVFALAACADASAPIHVGMVPRAPVTGLGMKDDGVAPPPVDADLAAVDGGLPDTSVADVSTPPPACTTPPLPVLPTFPPCSHNLQICLDYCLPGDGYCESDCMRTWSATPECESCLVQNQGYCISQVCPREAIEVQCCAADNGCTGSRLAWHECMASACAPEMSAVGRCVQGTGGPPCTALSIGGFDCFAGF